MYHNYLSLITLISIFTTLSQSEQFFIDLKEIEGVQYDIRITGDPVVFNGEKFVRGEELSAKEDTDKNDLENEKTEVEATTPKPPDDKETETAHHYVTMRNNQGQKYHCSVPLIQEESSSRTEGSSSEESNQPQEAEEKRDSKITDAKKLLDPMEEENCLLKTKDWWTYEFCYGSEIRQYHMEDGKPSGAIMKLGKYDHDFDWSQSKDIGNDVSQASSHFEKLHSLRQSKKGRPKYHSQYYVNGSTCDLTGELRKSEVRFECDPTAALDVITRIDEPQSCEYIIMVSTKKICSIPQFRPQEFQKPKEIKCSPVFSQHQYDKWTLYQKNKREIEKQRMVEAQERSKQEMLKTLEGEDISHIDINSDEGLAQIESMVGDKMAKKLIDSIGDILGTSKPKKEIQDKKETIVSIEEVTLPSGEKQSRIIEGTEIGDDLIEIKEYVKKKENDDPKTSISELTKQIKEVNDKMEKMLGRNAVDKVANEDQATEQPLSLDPRSDLSDEKELLKELENTVFKLTKAANPQQQDTLSRVVASKDGKIVASQKLDEAESSSGVLKTTGDMKILKKMVKSKLEESIEDIIEETADEMDMELDGLERSKAVEELTTTFYDIMGKLDNVEAKMEKVQKELSKTDEMILNGEKKLSAIEELLSKEDNSKEQEDDIKNEMSRTLDNLDAMKGNLDKLSLVNAEDIGQQNSLSPQPHESGTSSTTTDEDKAKTNIEKDVDIKETSEHTYNSEEKKEQSTIKIATATVNAESANVRGLENTDSEKRVVKHLESAIKEKLSQSGFDTGGRQIEVKVITATGLPFGKKSKIFGSKSLNGAGGVSSLLGEALGLAAGDNTKDDDEMSDLEGLGSQEEEKQLQNMMYNLMIGNQEGFNEIDNQRKSENNYRFSFEDQLKRQEEVLAKESAKRSIENEESLLEDIKLLQETSSEGSPVVQGEIEIEDNAEVETEEDFDKI